MAMIKPFLQGAFMTFSSTAAGCLGAVYIEKISHRALFRCFPHLYRDVDSALGIDPSLLDAVRKEK
jgi:hypothetical protein